MKLIIIDYGMGNLGSVRRAIEECGEKSTTSGNSADLNGAHGLILPGVGAFKEGMDRLAALGLVETIREAVKEGVPLLGICLGMQLLADHGQEGGDSAGLGLIPGEIQRFLPTSSSERIPHVGWNQVNWKGKQEIAEEIPPGTDFYFVHSYHFVPKEESSVAAKTPYCGEFVSAVKRGEVYGTQFHPEKSSRGGFRLLKNFLELCRTKKTTC